MRSVEYETIDNQLCEACAEQFMGMRSDIVAAAQWCGIDRKRTGGCRPHPAVWSVDSGWERKRGVMIARIWRGWTTHQNAEVKEILRP
jgi:hypothetical protein